MSPAASARHLSHKQQLGLAGLVALIFLEVCGGPFGSEESVQYGGPLIAIIGFIVLPIIWSVPEALVTAELATAFPENAGYVVWVGTAFGPFWGFLEGLFSWISGVTDNTIYPVVFVSYLKLFWSAIDQNWWLEKSALMVSSLAMTVLNWRGLDIVGKAAEVILVVTMLPFLVLGVLAIPHIKVSNWGIAKPLRQVQWSEYLNVMFWNLNYWDSVSTLAGEVRNPGKIFPRALGLGVLLVASTYLFPLMIGIGVTTDTDADWSLGYYGHVAELVGGKWLALAMVVSAAVSQIGQFEAEMSSDSYQVLGMAERGYLPKIFAMRSRYGTPVVGILLSSAGIMTTLFFSFMEIVELLNAVYCMAELLEFAAFIYLRVKRPDLHRDFKVPLGIGGLLLMLLPASLLLITLLVLPVVTMRWQVIVYTIGVALLGLFIYPLLQLLRRTRSLDFVTSELDAERWSPSCIAASMTLFPTLFVLVGLVRFTAWPKPFIAATVIAAACALCLLLWAGVSIALRKFEVERAPRLSSTDGTPSANGSTPIVVDLNTPLLDPFLDSTPSLSVKVS